MTLYSTAIMAPPDAAEIVFGIRKDIKELVGKLDRESTEPHITFNVFSFSLLNYWQQHIKQRISVVEPFTTTFHLSVMPVDDKYAMMFVPDQESKMKLKKLMKSINSESPKKMGRTDSPHMTVAYNLTYNQSEVAKQYILDKAIGLTFTCRDIAIRKREKGKMEHYLVIETLRFGEPVEGLLF